MKIRKLRLYLVSACLSVVQSLLIIFAASLAIFWLLDCQSASTGDDEDGITFVSDDGDDDTATDGEDDDSDELTEVERCEYYLPRDNSDCGIGGCYPYLDYLGWEAANLCGYCGETFSQCVVEKKTDNGNFGCGPDGTRCRRFVNCIEECEHLCEQELVCEDSE